MKFLILLGINYETEVWERVFIEKSRILEIRVIEPEFFTCVTVYITTDAGTRRWEVTAEDYEVMIKSLS